MRFNHVAYDLMIKSKKTPNEMKRVILSAILSRININGVFDNGNCSIVNIKSLMQFDG